MHFAEEADRSSDRYTLAHQRYRRTKETQDMLDMLAQAEQRSNLDAMWRPAHPSATDMRHVIDRLI
jgi:hypothetical protein